MTISDLAVLADVSDCFEPTEWAAALQDDMSLETVQQALSGGVPGARQMYGTDPNRIMSSERSVDKGQNWGQCVVLGSKAAVSIAKTPSLSLAA